LSDAITRRNGKRVIFLLKDGKAVETPIETGEKIGDMVEILKGATVGDKVILRPEDGLDNGDKVKTAAK
jgi:multidrug efflux pump subunit AcrA (membrane-fusion protein)